MVARVVVTRRSAPPRSIWLRGARTVSQAQDETGLSRDELFALMGSGVLRWFSHGGRRTRIIAWGDLVDYLDRLHREHGAGVRTT